MIEIEAAIDATTFKRTFVNRYGSHYNETGYRTFKEELGCIARQAMKGREPLTGQVRVEIKIYRQRKPDSLQYGDLDNHLKAILDSISGICFKDDRQVISAAVDLYTGAPSIRIKVMEYEVQAVRQGN